MDRSMLLLLLALAHLTPEVSASCSDLASVTDTYWGHYADGTTNGYNLRFSTSKIEVVDSAGTVAATGTYSCLAAAQGGICSFTEGSFSCQDGLAVGESTYVLMSQDGTGSEVLCLQLIKRDATLIYKLALSDDQARTNAGECRTQLDSDTVMGYVIAFSTTYDHSSSTCPGEITAATWLAQYQTDAGWQCEGMDTSTGTVGAKQIVLDSCYSQTPSYYSPYDATFTCVDHFSSTLVAGTSADGAIVILKADLGGTTRYFSVRYNRAYSTPNVITMSLAAIDEDYCAIPRSHTYSQFTTLNPTTGSGYKTLRLQQILPPTIATAPDTTAAAPAGVTTAAANAGGANTAAAGSNDATTAVAGSNDATTAASRPDGSQNELPIIRVIREAANNDCPNEVAVDPMSDDLSSDKVLVLQIQYNYDWHCNITTMLDDIKTPLVAKVMLAVGAGYQARLRYLRSGSMLAEVAIISPITLKPEVVSMVGTQLQSVVSAGNMDFMLDGATIPVQGPLQYVYGDGHATEIDDACFNYDARDLCNDGTCSVNISMPYCMCPDGNEDPFCATGGNEELILIIVLACLSVLAIGLLIFLGCLICRRRRKQRSREAAAGIMRHRGEHIPGPPKQPLPNPEDEDQEEDPYTPGFNSVAVHQPIHYANRGYTGPGQLSPEQLKANGIGSVTPNRGTVYKITNTCNESYDWVKL